MKVFISWSGDRSNKVARALSDWIPCVIQAVKPWMSEQIAKGARWSPEIARALEETRFGIVCLTPENLTSPWILFETGALSKTIESTYVCPYLLGLKHTDVQGPLAQFEAAKADATDTLELIKTINNAQGELALPGRSIESAFNKWWPELHDALEEISKQPAPPPDQKKRTEMDLLEEILDTVRQLSRDARSEWTHEIIDSIRKDIAQRYELEKAELDESLAELTRNLERMRGKQRDEVAKQLKKMGLAQQWRVVEKVPSGFGNRNVIWIQNTENSVDAYVDLSINAPPVFDELPDREKQQKIQDAIENSRRNK